MIMTLKNDKGNPLSAPLGNIFLHTSVEFLVVPCLPHTMKLKVIYWELRLIDSAAVL